MKIRILFLIIFIYAFHSCNKGGTSKNDNNTGLSIDVPFNSINPFWESGCADSDLSCFFDCNKIDSYQIELSADPFKDFVVINVCEQDSLFDFVYYNRFIIKTSLKNSPLLKEEKKKVFSIINDHTNDTLFCYHGKTQKIKTVKLKQLRPYFLTTIREIPVQDSLSDMMDGEVWKVKSRVDNSVTIVVRRNLKDSIFYLNIQKVLDVCNIEDYKY